MPVVVLSVLDEVENVSETKVDSVWLEEDVVVSESAGECTALLCEKSVEGELASMPMSMCRL